MTRELRRLRVARALLSVIAVILFFGPLLRDSNESHLLNPTWPGHARLHFMWAISFMFCSGLANLYYLWAKPLDLAVLRLCAVWQATSLFGGFWTAVGTALIVSLLSWAASSAIGGNGRIEIYRGPR